MFFVSFALARDGTPLRKVMRGILGCAPLFLFGPFVFHSPLERTAGLLDEACDFFGRLRMWGYHVRPLTEPFFSPFRPRTPQGAKPSSPCPHPRLRPLDQAARFRRHHRARDGVHDTRDPEAGYSGA